MGNDTAPHRDNQKSHLHSSTESVDDMDTSDSTPSQYQKPHTYRKGCPYCSGLCSLRGSPRSPPGNSFRGAGTDLSVGRPTIGYAGTTKDYRVDCVRDITTIASSSYKFTNRDNHSASSHGGAIGTTWNHRSDAPLIGNAVGYGSGGASSTRNTVGDPGRPFINSNGSYGFGNTEPFKSSYEAGYEEGLKVGYQLALAEFSGRSVNASNGNGSDGRNLLALENGDAFGCDDNGIGAGGGSINVLLALENGDASGCDDNGIGAGCGSINVDHQLRRHLDNSNYNNSSREIVLFTDTTGQAGQSNVQSSANGGRVFDTEADKEAEPHNTERAGEHSPSSFSSHARRCAEPGGNVLGMTETDKASILSYATNAGNYSNTSSPTHSNHKDTKEFNSVRPKSRSTSYNGPTTREKRSPQSLLRIFGGKGSTFSVNENANGWDASRKGKKNSYHSSENLGAETSTQRQTKFRKKPASQQETLLAEYTTEVFHLPLSSGVATTRGVSASTSSGNNTAAIPPDCSICITSLAEDSPYLKAQDVSRDLVGCAALKRCGHHFHISCLMQMAAHDASWLTCPNCQTIHGVRIGTQPKGGTMNHRKYGGNLPGLPKSSGTIEITYSFRHGNQGPEHPNPGRPYRLVGFPRVAYLPDTAQGNKVLKLLRVAFDRRLIFTVGTSATSGSTDCVVWNGIHHKTETHDSSGHGYPDPKYLDNVMMELASFGVT